MDEIDNLWNGFEENPEGFALSVLQVSIAEALVDAAAVSRGFIFSEEVRQAYVREILADVRVFEKIWRGEFTPSLLQ